MKDTEKAARVTGPMISNDATWRTGVLGFANTGSAQSEPLPAVPAGEKGGKNRMHALAGRFIRLAAVGVDIQYGFATSAVSLTRDAQAAGGPPKAPSALRGATLFAGTEKEVLVPGEATHLCWIAASGSGQLEFYCSDQPVV